MGKWKRPESTSYPSIWRRFEGVKINGNKPKFWVQDLPEELFNTAIDFMCSNFIFETPMCKYEGVGYDPDSVEEVKELYKTLAPDKMALVCFMENPNPQEKPIIAGVNMTYICEKDSNSIQCKSKKLSKILDTVLYVCSQHNPFTELGIERYLGAFGLSVLPEYRGQGIGFELLLARTDLCRATGITATLTVFTSIASQKLAVKAGFKDLVNMSYDEIAEKEPRFTYPGISENTKYIRYMYKMID